MAKEAYSYDGDVLSVYWDDEHLVSTTFDEASQDYFFMVSPLCESGPAAQKIKTAYPIHGNYLRSFVTTKGPFVASGHNLNTSRPDNHDPVCRPLCDRFECDYDMSLL